MTRGNTISENDLFTRNAFRKVFTSADGRMVFERMLLDLGFFESAETEDAKALRNYATYLMEIMGIFHESNSSHVVDLLLKTKQPEQVEVKDAR